MIAPLAFLRRLTADKTGSTVIETAIVLPPLILLGFGSFDVSRMISRQSELQKAANEASDIVRAAAPDSDAKKATVRAVIQTSTGLGVNNVILSTVYRCGTNSSYVTTTSSCGEHAKVSTYIKVIITDTYTPMWRNFGMGTSVSYNVTRQVQIS